jgi:hypothetical protein
MSTEGNDPRDAYGRGVPMTKRELVKCAQRAGRKPQNAAVDGPAGWSGPSEAVDGLPHATKRSRIGPRGRHLGYVGSTAAVGNRGWRRLAEHRERAVEIDPAAVEQPLKRLQKRIDGGVPTEA